MPAPLDFAPQARRGAVFHLYRIDFGDVAKPKYCVLLEDFTPRADMLVVCFTTTNMRFRDYPTSISLPRGTIPGMQQDCIIQVDNWTEIHCDYLLSKKSALFLGQLPKQKLVEVDNAIRDILADDYIFYRIAPH